jgi:hypothetical protein
MRFSTVSTGWQSLPSWTLGSIFNWFLGGHGRWLSTNLIVGAVMTYFLKDFFSKKSTYIFNHDFLMKIFRCLRLRKCETIKLETVNYFLVFKVREPFLHGVLEEWKILHILLHCNSFRDYFSIKFFYMQEAA